MKIDITRLVKKIVKERAKSNDCYKKEDDYDDYSCGSSSFGSCGYNSNLYGGRC